MLAEFDRIQDEHGPDKLRDLRKTLAMLLRQQFIFAGDRGTALAYNTAMDNRFRAAIDGFFDCCGYTVHREPEEQWVGIVPNDTEIPLPKMRLEETIVMLVLAAHWQDEVNVGAVEDRAVVRTSLNMLHHRYQDMTQAGGRSIIPPAKLHEILREAAQRGLVSIGEYDPDESDYEVEIRPMIKLISGDDALKKLESYASYEEARRPPEPEPNPQDNDDQDVDPAEAGGHQP
ncbi:hypothetical protein RHODGE_RHODGE_03522 [Rhodoplanes serenus]|uniref:DUF4194 domain-containing protein n=1 Tax=Rhodoplanes serenus TaxID=200615 RepID=A0A3S4BY28_9BRAD|nr:DUF4194 domain-containing protein [Rhodoplanes serenus]VCU10333.1 hypothetical protein RHODGE_RHODGE_03522 [Rhodoplanes serenus]